MEMVPSIKRMPDPMPPRLTFTPSLTSLPSNPPTPINPPQEVYVKAATSSHPDVKPILSQPSTSSSPARKSSKKGSAAAALPPPPSLPTDVPTLQQALLTAEGRLVGFQTREQAYLRILTEKEKETADLQKHLRELALYQSPPETWARKALVDPGM